LQEAPDLVSVEILATCVMICLLNKSAVNVIVCMKWEFKQHKKCLACLVF